MNILSGRFKGYKIDTSLNTTYRPTKSSVRKSLFDKLKAIVSFCSTNKIETPLAAIFFNNFSFY